MSRSRIAAAAAIPVLLALGLAFTFLQGRHPTGEAAPTTAAPSSSAAGMVTGVCRSPLSDGSEVDDDDPDDNKSPADSTRSSGLGSDRPSVERPCRYVDERTSGRPSWYRGDFAE